MNITFHTTRACNTAAISAAVANAVGRLQAVRPRNAMTLSQKGVFVH